MVKLFEWPWYTNITGEIINGESTQSDEIKFHSKTDCMAKWGMKVGLLQHWKN